MIFFRPTAIFILLASLFTLPGCNQDRPVTAYKPGVYKGKSDDLLQKSGPAQQEQLRNRFMMVQTDR